MINPLSQIRSLIREHIKLAPELLLYIISLAATAIEIIVFMVFPEARLAPEIVEAIPALGLLAYAYSTDIVPLVEYSFTVALLLTGLIHNMIYSHPFLYIALTVALLAMDFKIEPVLTRLPMVDVVIVKARRILRNLKPPENIEEAKLASIMGAVHIISIALSFALLVAGYTGALLTLAYSTIGLIYYFLGIGARRIPVKKLAKGYSLALLLLQRYPWMFRLNMKYAKKLDQLIEKAGIRIVSYMYLAKYVVATIILAQVAPTIILVANYLFPLPVNMVISVASVVAPLVTWYIPVISISAKISARRRGVEREYPLFLSYLTVVISAGRSMTGAMRGLLTSKGRELFKAFSKEAEYFISLIDIRKMTEIDAISHLMETHPSDVFRNFLLGYLNQLRVAGDVTRYVEDRFAEALELEKRKLEEQFNRLMILMEIIIMILTFPSVVIILSYLLSPGSASSIMYSMTFLVAPATALMFYLSVEAIQGPNRNIYRLTYIPGAIGGIVALLVSIFVLRLDLVLTATVTLIGIALAHYIEFLKTERVYRKIEEYLPTVWRDLSNMRQMMPLNVAIEKLGNMDYPKEVKTIVSRMATLRKLGRMIADHPWHSGSFYWKLSQFLIGMIEATGGGTTRIFHNLMNFFTHIVILRKMSRQQSRLYEMIVYGVPVILIMTLLVGLAILNPTTQAIKATVKNYSNVAATVPMLQQLLSGVGPTPVLLSKLMILEVSVLLGLGLGKLNSGTLKDTRPLAVVLLVYLVSLMLIPHFVSHLVSSNPVR